MDLIKFSKIEIPTLDERAYKNNNYYFLGVDNKYYDFLFNLYRDSPTHSSIINNQINRIIGTGFQSDNEVDKALIDKYKLNEWLEQTCRDLVILGGFATEIIWNKLHSYINSFYPVKLERLRIGLINEDLETPSLYYYSQHFSDYVYSNRNKDIKVYTGFDKDPNTDFEQILYNFGNNRIGNDIYPIASYSSSIPYIITDIKIPIYYMNLVNNNFMVSQILVVPYTPDEDQREKFEEGLKERFTTPENGGSVLIVYSQGDGSEVKLIPVSGSDSEKKYDELLNLVIESIARGNGLSSPLLAGLSLPGNLFGVTDLPTLEKQYNTNIIWKRRKQLMDEFSNKINPYLKQPISQYKIDDINMFMDEKTN